MMELIWLEDFLALAEIRNFSRAAAARNVTQPAFSRRIRALEDYLGVSLFERSSAGVMLTPAGATLHPGAEDIVRRVRQVTREVRHAGREDDETLLFAATHALSFTFFPRWMRELERTKTLGPIRLVSDSLQGCETLMSHGDVQFLLCHHHAMAPPRFPPNRFASRVVGHDRLEPFCAPGPDGRPQWALDADEGDIPYLAYSAESGLGRILDVALFHQHPTDRFQTVVTSHLAAALRSLAQDGRGLAWLPRTLVEDDLLAGRLVSAQAQDRFTVEVEIVLIRALARQRLPAETFWMLGENRRTE